MYFYTHKTTESSLMKTHDQNIQTWRQVEIEPEAPTLLVELHKKEGNEIQDVVIFLANPVDIQSIVEITRYGTTRLRNVYLVSSGTLNKSGERKMERLLELSVLHDADTNKRGLLFRTETGIYIDGFTCSQQVQHVLFSAPTHMSN
ncbi:hypothetical protein NG726_02490 [Pseudomonas sp. MOB-449]|nr:hypothetical protein [Pseudomonas sp. MOB-449]